MSTRTPSIGVIQEKRIAEIQAAWDKCRANNAVLEGLIREALQFNTPSMEWRARAQAALAGEEVKDAVPTSQR